MICDVQCRVDGIRPFSVISRHSDWQPETVNPKFKTIEGKIIYQGARLHFTRWGEGPQVLLAFHGFGQTRAHFGVMAAALPDDYTLYAFDLFFHGQSYWPFKSEPLTNAFWQHLLNTFLKQEGVQTFGLLGFSMGGKFALATFSLFPERITQLILIAPDGIKTSFWYSLATYPPWTRRWFRYVTVKPGAFRRMAYALRKLRLADKGLIRFAESQMNTRSQRHRVYFSWIVFKELKFKLPHLSALLNWHQIPVTLFLGAYDRIITRKNMRVLVSKVAHCQLVVLPMGHNRLIEAVANYYKQKTP